jgi:ACT domain-containing protein
MEKIIVSVIGRDKVGIIAATTQTLSEANANILDISQTIMQDYFTMILVADISRCTISFAALKDNLHKTGERIGLQINTQKAEIFDFMHRI